jgi:hypothetical protein
VARWGRLRYSLFRDFPGCVSIVGPGALLKDTEQSATGFPKKSEILKTDMVNGWFSSAWRHNPTRVGDEF